MNDVAWRLLLLIVAGVVAYRIISKRKQRRAGAGGGMYWKEVVEAELEQLKESVPVEHYINILALSRSQMSDQECLTQLDKMVDAMREKQADPEPVLELMQKIRDTVRN